MASEWADERSMFSLCSEPPVLREADLYHLCASLNAPVVNIDALPVGPVRAAIVLHAERNGQGVRIPQLTVGLRSLETGRVAVYRFTGEVRKLNSASRAVDVALSFAESMGFLFDEDLVGGARGTGQTRALSLWQKLVGQDDASWDAEAGFDDVVSGGDLDPETGELLLAEVKESSPPPAPPAAPKGRAEPAAEPSASTRKPTARTRSTDDEAGGHTQGSTLGRVPLVRMRVKAERGAENAEAEKEARQLRLLGNF